MARGPGRDAPKWQPRALITSNARAIPLTDLASTPLPGSVMDKEDNGDVGDEEEGGDRASRGFPCSSNTTNGAFVDVIPSKVASGENQCAELNE